MTNPNPNPQDPPTKGNKSSSETVTVCCKLPHGLVLRAFVLADAVEAHPGGSRDIKKAQQVMGEFTVHGNSFPEQGAPRTNIDSGFAITPNCPKDLWQAWLKDNREMPAVKNGLIFAHDSERSAVAEVREKVAVRSGFERLDPAKLPSGIQKAKDLAPA